MEQWNNGTSMDVMISYDIKSDTRRQKIYHLLKDYGTWVQYSVFECHISDKDYRVLRRRLEPLIQKDEADNIRVYQICGECERQIEHLGRKPSGERASGSWHVGSGQESILPPKV